MLNGLDWLRVAPTMDRDADGAPNGEFWANDINDIYVPESAGESAGERARHKDMAVKSKYATNNGIM